MKTHMKTKNRLLLGIAILLSILCIRARTVINLAENVTGILGTSQGGNGTSSPALTAGTNITFGPGSTWPNYTINASNTGGPTVLSGSAITPSDYEFKNGSTYYVWPPYYATTDPTGEIGRAHV